MGSYSSKTMVKAEIRGAGGLAAILKPYHTTKASIEAFSLSKEFISDEEYLYSTFSTMIEVRRNGSKFSQTPIVMSFRETKDELYEDIRRIFSLQGDKIHISALFTTFGVPSMNAAQEFDSGIEPLMRLLMARGGVNMILVTAEAADGTEESGEAFSGVEL